jgi:hypothetical protein
LGRHSVGSTVFSVCKNSEMDLLGEAIILRPSEGGN